MLSTVATVGRLVDEFEHSPAAAEPLLAALASLAACDGALLAAVDGPTGRHRLVASIGYPQAVADFVVDGYPSSCPGYAFSRGLGLGLPVRMCDIPFDYRGTQTYCEVLEPAGFHEGVTVCLRSGRGEYVGLLTLSSTHQRPAGPEALVTLSALSARLASVAADHRTVGPSSPLAREGEVVVTVATRPGRVGVPMGADDDLPLGRAELLAVARLTVRSRRDRVGFFHQDARRRWWAVRAQRTRSTGADVDVVIGVRAQCPPHGLTARELEILTLMVSGLPNAEIADRLHTSVSTVKTHVEHILHKLGSTSRAGAVGTASDHLLLSWPHLD